MKVERIVVPPVPPCEFHITLSEAEAIALLKLTGCVNGDVKERDVYSCLAYALRRFIPLETYHWRDGYQAITLKNQGQR